MTTRKKTKKQENLIDNLPGKEVKLPDGSTTKTTYLVKVIHTNYPNKTTTLACYVTAKIDVFSYGIDFVGYPVDSKSAEQVKTEKDAVDLANKGSRELYSITYPWHQVLSVRNVSYRNKQ